MSIMPNSIDDLDDVELGGMVNADGKYALSSDSVILLKDTVSEIDALERAFGDVETRIKAMCANLRRVLESNSQSVMSLGSTVAEIRINYSHYHAVRNIFMYQWNQVRKLGDINNATVIKTCSKAFERYFGLTGLTVPLSDDAKAVAKREKEQAEANRLKAIPNIETAKADAAARGDFEEALVLKKEGLRRQKEANKDELVRLADKKSELFKIIKDSIDEDKLDMVLAWYKGSVKLVAEKKVSRAT
jgi:hypothetical protein